MTLRILVLTVFLCSPYTGTSVSYDFGSDPERIIRVEDSTSGRIRGFQDRIDRDFIIGGLFAVHRAATGSAGGQCSSVLVRSGVERTEAFLYALDAINSDPNILPNVKLGYDIRDTCVSENVALDESVDLLFTEGLPDPDVCNVVLNNSSSSNISSSRSVTALIGPTTSQVSLSVASLLRLFTTPEVSYSASSAILNNRDRYNYFYRTIPSDDQQAQAMIDLAIEFGWTYITAIHSNNAYGEPGLDRFRQLAEQSGICIDLDIGLDDDLTPEQYYQFASQVFNNSVADVIVFFASLHYVEPFMEQLSIFKRNTGNSRHFVWIASDSWAQAINIQTKYPEIIAGLWGFIPLTNMKANFNDYISQLTLNSNKRNPWFTEYYEDYFDCIAGDTCKRNVPVTDHSEYVQRTYIQLVIDAVYSVGHALNNFLIDNCDYPVVWDAEAQMCIGQKQELSGTVLRNYLQNVNFTSPSGNKISFDESGNIEAQYEITNFQMKDGEYMFKTTGLWVSSSNQRLQIFRNISLQFGVNESGEPLMSFESQCQKCPPGYVKVSVQSSCCGTCSPCLGQNYSISNNATECSTCPGDTWGNDPLSGSDLCQRIKETYLNPSDGFGILLIIIAIIGLISIILVSIALGIFWNAPIIKSSGREQMILLLVGISICFLVTFFFVAKPSVSVCLFQRVFTWFCFSLILSALFIKLVRIARIFLRDQTSKRPRFIEPLYQILLTFLLVGVQMIFVIVSLVVVHPEATETLVLNSKNTLDSPTSSIQCSSPHIGTFVVQLLFYSVLLIATNVLAVFTIQFPENFNEVRYVAFSTFSTLLIWFAFLHTYFAVDKSFRSAVICFAIQLTALAVLICLFVPRIFIRIFWKKEKEDRDSSNFNAAYTTTVIPMSNSNRKISAPNTELNDFTGNIYFDAKYMSSKESTPDADL